MGIESRDGAAPCRIGWPTSDIFFLAYPQPLGTMNLKQLEYFIQVARHGNLSHAATALRMGQPALSRHIRGLEVELRRSLFHRNGRGVVLTDAGARFLSYAQNALSQLESGRTALDESDGDLVGRVTVGMTPSVAQALTVPLVRAFQQRFGKANISITEGLSATLQEQVLVGRTDLAVVHSPVPSALLHIEPLVDESLYLLSPPGDGTPFPSKGTVNLKELANLRLIFPAQPHPIRRLLESEANRQGLALEVILDVGALTSIPLLVQAGCGHAVVPESVLWAGLPGRQALAIRRLARPRLQGRLSLVSSSRRPQTLLFNGTESIVRDLIHRFATRPR